MGKNDLFKNVLVIGMGRSGNAAAKLLLSADASVTVFDGNTSADTGAFEDMGCKAILGEDALSKADPAQFSLAVISPGVPFDGSVATMLKEAGVTIWGEIELAWYFEKGSVLAITGTNGKTTTTSLLGQIAQSYNEHTIIAGNIGVPYTGMVQETSADSITVLEISSFQLETVTDFCPKVSAILNITPDHLDRHHTMENYIKAKQDITKRQTKNEFCILNAEDPYTEEFVKTCPASVVLFSSGKMPKEGFWYDNGVIYRVSGGQAERIIALDETHLLGTHNAENIMAAIAMADAFGIPMDVILKAVKQFRAVEHRIEFVKNVNGVDYYNDSKGTNPDAAIKAIQAMNRPTWLIGGGYDKNASFDEWIESFDGKVRGLVLLGQTAEKIRETAQRHGFENIYMAESLKEAVDICSSNAVDGEAVLLSPACASWGMFKNFEERGNMFKELVNSLKKGLMTLG